MKLSDKQRKVLRAVQLQARVPLSQIARATGMREGSVRSALQYLLNRKIIWSSAFINLSPLGFGRYNLFVSYLYSKKKSKDLLIKDLVSDPSVIFVAEVGGDWNLEISFAVRGAGELAMFLDRLSQLFEGGIVDKSLVMTLEKHLFGSKFLSPETQVPPLSLLPRKAAAAITEIDHRILYELANTPSASFHEISRKIKVPVSTIAYRVGKLESAGIIEGWYYVQDAMIYQMLRFKLVLFTRRLPRKTGGRLYAFCRHHPNTDLLFMAAGSHDFEIVVQAESYDQVTGLIEDLRREFSEELSHIRVIPTFKVHKFSDYPFSRFEMVSQAPELE